MPHNTFNDIDIVSTSIAFAAGVWGSFISFIRRDTQEYTVHRKVSVFLMDMCINIGLTLLVYLGLIGYGINDLLAVAVSGFIGHQGTRSFYLIELIITEKLGAKATFEEVKKDRTR